MICLSDISGQLGPQLSASACSLPFYRAISTLMAKSHPFIDQSSNLFNSPITTSSLSLNSSRSSSSLCSTTSSTKDAPQASLLTAAPFSTKASQYIPISLNANHLESSKNGILQCQNSDARKMSASSATTTDDEFLVEKTYSDSSRTSISSDDETLPLKGSPYFGSFDDVSSLEKLLALKRIDKHTFVNCSELFIPYRGRGLFGGTMASQAILAALLFSNTVEKKWKPISIHCHFLYAAQPQPQLFYKVASLKDGKNYRTLSVDLFQNDKLIFRATCSLQAYELSGSASKLNGQLSHHKKGPVVGKDIDPPEKMFSQKEAFSAWSKVAYKHKHLGYLKDALAAVTASYSREPCVWKLPLDMFDLNKVSESEKSIIPSERTLRYWVKTKEPLADAHVFSWVALAYVSDYFFLSTNMRLNMREMFTTKFSVSLDHTIYFNTETDVSDWFNYNVKSLKSGENRTIMAGEMFDRAGNLLATTYQEGLSVIFTD